MLEGKKTYITAAALALASFALSMGWLSHDQYQLIIGLLGSLGLAALRSGMARAGRENGVAAPPGETAADSRGGGSA